MALTYYELSSWHPDPEWHLEPPTFGEEWSESEIVVRTQHSTEMPECVARLLHNHQVCGVLDNYDLGLTPKENYEIHRVDDNYEVPF